MNSLNSRRTKFFSSVRCGPSMTGPECITIEEMRVVLTVINNDINTLADNTNAVIAP